MSFKKGVIIIFIIFSFAIAIGCIFYCIDRQSKYKELVEENPPTPQTMVMIDSLENVRSQILSTPSNELSADQVIKVAMINLQYDSILYSQQYISDIKNFQPVNVTFTEQESKLNTQWLLGALGVLIGIAFGTWSSIIFFSRRKMQLLARTNRYTGPEIKY